MHRTRPEPPPRAERGVTLVELVVTIVLLGIIVSATAYFVYPVRQASDLAVRAELTDIANNALQRIGRDVRLALPNSVRVDGTGKAIEFLAIRVAGRYRADGAGDSGSGTSCPDDGNGQPGSNQLTFDTAADGCFKTIGPLQNATTVLATDFLVLNNYGPGFINQNAYDASDPNPNRSQIACIAAPPGCVELDGGRHRITFAATTFRRGFHDSSGRRFYVASGPVSYVCDTVARTLTRYAGYAISASQPAPPAGAGSVALIAENVASCSFDYSANVAPQIGLLTLRVTIAKALSGGETESVGLYHAVHVSNVP